MPYGHKRSSGKARRSSGKARSLFADLVDSTTKTINDSMIDRVIEIKNLDLDPGLQQVVVFPWADYGAQCVSGWKILSDGRQAEIEPSQLTPNIVKSLFKLIDTSIMNIKEEVSLENFNLLKSAFPERYLDLLEGRTVEQALDAGITELLQQMIDSLPILPTYISKIDFEPFEIFSVPSPSVGKFATDTRKLHDARKLYIEGQLFGPEGRYNFGLSHQGLANIIHKSAIKSLPKVLQWYTQVLQTCANLTRDLDPKESRYHKGIEEDKGRAMIRFSYDSKT